jgi:nickel-dependent lactate racemase
MPAFSLPYNRSEQVFSFPDGQVVDLYLPPSTPPAPDPAMEVARALAGFDFTPYQRARRVAIAINDKTRPVPHEWMLPPLLENLCAAGIQPEQVHFLIATGTHTPMPADEIEWVLPPEIAGRYSVSSHDCDDDANLVSLGTTRLGTPVAINRLFMEADLRIVVGNVEPHHFMGFSGGAKTAGIGLAGRETILRNHTLLMLPEAQIGRYAGNPIREDLEEIGGMIGIHLALNGVLNAQREIVRAFAGDPLSVMRAAIPVSRQVCQTPVRGRYDLVIASAGGAPKDINLYQAQKALTHAALLTRDGGVAVLVGACPEGVGSAGYERFMQGVRSHEEVFTKFASEGFSIGPHKAFQFAREAHRIGIIVLSELPEEKVRALLLTPARSPAEALDLATRMLGVARPTVALLPKATSTIPVLEAESA